MRQFVRTKSSASLSLLGGIYPRGMTKAWWFSSLSLTRNWIFLPSQRSISMYANYRTQRGVLLSESNETPTRPACILSRWWRALVCTAQEVMARLCVHASLSTSSLKRKQQVLVNEFPSVKWESIVKLVFPFVRYISESWRKLGDEKWCMGKVKVGIASFYLFKYQALYYLTLKYQLRKSTCTF